MVIQRLRVKLLSKHYNGQYCIFSSNVNLIRIIVLKSRYKVCDGIDSILCWSSDIPCVLICNLLLCVFSLYSMNFPIY